MSSMEGAQDLNNAGRRRGGRGCGRGSGGRGGGGMGQADNLASGGDGGASRGRGRGGRGRGRGRGNRDRAQSQGQTVAPGQADPTNAQPPPQPGGAGVFGSRLTKDAEKKPSGEKAPADDDDDSDLCFICASPIDHQAVAPCNHRTCHVCALRLRALYKTKACATCRTEAATVVFTDDPEKRYDEYVATDFYQKDDNMGISYEKQEIFEDTVILLRYNCPDADCDVACLGWPDLHRHVRIVHQKVMCDLCTRNKKVFTHEHQLFTQQELRKHERKGDDNPGAADQTGFEGHPECGFCRQRFYGRDELYTHCRDRHERCHLCDRVTDANNPRYFLDYNALEQHFNKDHYPCSDAECMEKKFVVFDSAMDLKAHQLEQHPNGLTKDARRDARRVDISSFNYRSEYQQERLQRGGRRGGRGRDPNAEGLPPSASGHMSRAEVAHQRAREIQSAQSVSSRTFGGQLSAPEPPSQVVSRPPQSPRPATAQASIDQAATAVAAAAPRGTEQLTPQEQARGLRHAAVTERAANLLRNDQTKIGSFRERISAYRNGAVSAPDLIDTFFSLFDTSSKELGKLIKELADIFEISGKSDALLKAWSDWKAINEDYPSLPGPSGANATSAAGVLGQGMGTSRVLKLKSSTAQSSRSSQQASWGTAAAPRPTAASSAQASGPAFPSLPSRGKAPPAPTPSWLALRPTGSSTSSSARPSPAPSRTVSSQNIPKGSDAFPSLPAAKKPTSTVFSPGYSGAGVIRQNNSGSSTPVNAWGGSSAPGPAAETEGGDQRKAKGRKGKQVMFQWG